MTKDERALLELLAAVDDGATDDLLIASGFTLDMMVGLVRRGLVTAEPSAHSLPANRSGGTRVRLTDAGRRVLPG
jgi:hypothetical protein